MIAPGRNTGTPVTHVIIADCRPVVIRRAPDYRQLPIRRRQRRPGRSVRHHRRLRAHRQNGTYRVRSAARTGAGQGGRLCPCPVAPYPGTRRHPGDPVQYATRRMRRTPAQRRSPPVVHRRRVPTQGRRRTGWRRRHPHAHRPLRGKTRGRAEYRGAALRLVTVHARRLAIVRLRPHRRRIRAHHRPGTTPHTLIQLRAHRRRRRRPTHPVTARARRRRYRKGRQRPACKQPLTQQHPNYNRTYRTRHPPDSHRRVSQPVRLHSHDGTTRKTAKPIPIMVMNCLTCVMCPCYSPPPALLLR